MPSLAKTSSKIPEKNSTKEALITMFIQMTFCYANFEKTMFWETGMEKTSSNIT